MSRKKTLFAIDLPSEVEADGAGTASGHRRGPMAAAMRENADALEERSALEASIRKENDELAHEYVALRKQGLVVSLIPVDAILTTKLTRDRKEDRDEEALEELVGSIAEIGLSNPVHVERSGAGYELIQGSRRLMAFKELRSRSDGARYEQIPALVREPGETVERLYRRMVDENLVRKDISFGEMAALARSYAADEATEATSVDEAVGRLFASAGKQKRSYIRAFAELLDVLGPDLKHYDAVPRALGLELRRKVSDDAAVATAIRERLRAVAGAGVEAHLSVLRAFALEGQGTPSPDEFPAGNLGRNRKQEVRRARTTFDVDGVFGQMRCKASQGKLEIRFDMDLTEVKRHDLEVAVRAFERALAAAAKS
jgi:ParB family chromosome partitioning protein